jgi:periodic tryptophan protein 2
LFSPVSNRVVALDLSRHASSSVGIESRGNISLLALSPDGRSLIAIDVDGYAIVANVERKVIIARFSFKSEVSCVQFSPDGSLLAVGVGRSVQIWRSPTIDHLFSHFSLVRTFTSCHENITSIEWSPSGRLLACGSLDLTTRIFYIPQAGEAMPSTRIIPVTLSGHRDRIVGAMFSDEDTLYSISADGSLFSWVWQPGDGRDSLSRGTRPISNEDPEEDNRQLRKTSLRALSSKRRHSISGGMQPSTLGEWTLAKRHYLRQVGAKVSSIALHRPRNLLVIGLTDGTFGIYLMPSFENVHTLSISRHRITSVAINKTGDWVAFGSSELSQLLVWDWQAEIYVIKQQGHGQDVTCTAFSPNGQLVASGGEDGKVKLWNSVSGFSFVTFFSHTSTVTAVAFVGGKRGHGLVVLSASLDGTVRAYDLVRYRNFKTFSASVGAITNGKSSLGVAGQTTQFSCVAGDEAGEIVCAGGMDPFNVYVWSMQTGKLLDVLAGHTGPVSCISFSSAAGLVASGSWDKTVRLWDVFRSGGTASELFSHTADVVALAFRPDGLELSVSSLDGNVSIWDVRRGVQTSSISVGRDLAGGRRLTDGKRITNRHPTSLCYAADGSAILTGGNSKYICLYALPSKMLVRRFQISHNRSFDGVLDKLNSSRIGDDGINLDEGDFTDSEDEASGKRRARDAKVLPGVKVGDAASKRNVRKSIWSRNVTFSPAGDMFSVVTPDGVGLYKQIETPAFDPFQLGEDVTLDALEDALSSSRFSRAALIALHLNEPSAIMRMIDATPLAAIRSVTKAIPRIFIRVLLTQLAKRLVQAPHLEHSMEWIIAVLEEHSDALRSDASTSAGVAAILHQVQKSILVHRDSVSKLAEDNKNALAFICDAA